MAGQPVSRTSLWLRWGGALLAAIAGVAALLPSGCGDEADCAKGTARVSVRFPAAAVPELISQATVEFEVAGSVVVAQPITVTNNRDGEWTGKADVAFPGGYPKGARVVVRVFVKSPAAAGGAERVVATWFNEIEFSGGCAEIDARLFVVPGLDGGAVGDGGADVAPRVDTAAADGAPGPFDGARPDAPPGKLDGAAADGGSGDGARDGVPQADGGGDAPDADPADAPASGSD